MNQDLNPPIDRNGATSAPAATATRPAGTVTVPVSQEEVAITTRVVDTGRGVRVSKTVTEETEEVREILWQDSMDVRRVPVDKVVAEAPPSRYEGDTLVVPVLEEILVVEKRYRIKEELHITRVRKQHEHRETVPLRVEEVRVEAFDDGRPDSPRP
jgi:stress response protein YsnF